MGTDIASVGVAPVMVAPVTKSDNSTTPARADAASKQAPKSGREVLSDDEMRALAEKLSAKADEMVRANRIDKGLQFIVDRETDQTVIKVIDRETDELIRQIPNEEALDISRRVQEFLESGDLIDVRA